MCGRYVRASSLDELASWFDVDEVVATTDEAPPRYNVAPTQPVLAVASSRDGATRRLGLLRWGLVPHWAEDPGIGGARMINARAETVATTRAFRLPFRRRRCLVVADGYYEWRRVPGPQVGRPAREPFFLAPADDTPLAFAGLWDVWYDADSRPRRTCTIVTTAANATAGAVHDRMPVLLPAAALARWLAPEPLTRRAHGHARPRPRGRAPGPAGG